MRQCLLQAELVKNPLALEFDIIKSHPRIPTKANIEAEPHPLDIIILGVDAIPSTARRHWFWRPRAIHNHPPASPIRIHPPLFFDGTPLGQLPTPIRLPEFFCCLEKVIIVKPPLDG